MKAEGKVEEPQCKIGDEMMEYRSGLDSGLAAWNCLGKGSNKGSCS